MHTENKNDEIDLKEIFNILIEYKRLILVSTLLILLISMIGTTFYIINKEKMMKPIYHGKVMIEIGVIQGSDNTHFFIDSPIKLKEMIAEKFGLDSTIASENLLVIYKEDIDRSKILSELNTAISFIIQRHTDKVSFFKRSIATQKISDIIIKEKEVEKINKARIITMSLIISLVGGFLLSILLAFLLVILKDKEEKKI